MLFSLEIYKTNCSNSLNSSLDGGKGWWILLQPHQPIELEQQLPGQKGVTAPVCPAKKREEIWLPRLDFLGWQILFLEIKRQSSPCAKFYHLCLRCIQEPQVNGASLGEAVMWTTAGSMENKHFQGALTLIFPIRTKPRLLFAWIMYHMYVYTAVVPTVLFLYKIRSCKAQNP